MACIVEISSDYPNKFTIWTSFVIFKKVVFSYSNLREICILNLYTYFSATNMPMN